MKININTDQETKQEDNNKDKKASWIIYVLVLLLLIISLLFILMKYNNVTVEEVSGFATTSLENFSNKTSGSSNILFTGISPYYVSADGYVPLQNSEENECNLKYIISDENNNVVYESIAISPGLEDRWELDNNYSTGEHTFKVSINKILEDKTLGTGIVTNMKIVIQ